MLVKKKDTILDRHCLIIISQIEEMNAKGSPIIKTCTCVRVKKPMLVCYCKLGMATFLLILVHWLQSCLLQTGLSLMGLALMQMFSLNLLMMIKTQIEWELQEKDLEL